MLDAAYNFTKTNKPILKDREEINTSNVDDELNFDFATNEEINMVEIISKEEINGISEIENRKTFILCKKEMTVIR